MEPAEIAVVRLPSERRRLERLRRSGHARLILLEGDVEPPTLVDPAEDWVRVPADERDVVARQEGIRRRLAPTVEKPVLDDAGLLRFSGGWVSIPPMEVLLLEALIENQGGVVSREVLSERTWPDGIRGRNALDVHMLRLRRRVGEVGLVIRTVRSRGYLLETAPGTESVTA